MLSLAEAAQRIGLHRSNLLRAIKAGRISGSRDDSGNWRIDESELARVYGDLRSATLQPAQAGELLELKLAHAEQRIGDLMRALERAQRDIDDWKDQARRVARTATISIVNAKLCSAPVGVCPRAEELSDGPSAERLRQHPSASESYSSSAQELKFGPQAGSLAMLYPGLF